MFFKLDPDLEPGKEIEVDPDPEQGSKWIRIRPYVVDPYLKPCFKRMHYRYIPSTYLYTLLGVFYWVLCSHTTHLPVTCSS